MEDDQVVGRGEASPRPDRRLFLSIDAWDDAAFDRLGQAMLADLPKPLYTVVDEADHDLRARWERAGFVTGRREWELLIPTGPHLAAPPSEVKILGIGRAERAPLRELDRAIRDEVEASVGWHTMPAEVLVRLDDETVTDPSKYVVAATADSYVGLIRLAQVPRQPRIGLIAVRAGWQRRGIARALLAHVLDSLHRVGIPAASAEVDESNLAAVALFDGVAATRAGSTLELVHR
ncbi:GNAT family N-acetyltransferase [Hamadaea sp. NPDC050747]|uniref:GNAT family N-acetyltransferase n=1 Tax=Hamadaea sp. NPDC050747 TaxID=3155789 RepID=UPI00340AD71B